MSTMYVQNIPDDETVNLRREPSLSSAVLIRVPYGAAVKATPYDDTWTCACYDGRRGYIMSQFLASTKPDQCGCGDDGTPTAGVIRGTSVRVRAEPSTSAAILAHVNTGDRVTYYAGKTYSGSGYRWFRCTGAQWSGVGYIASDYVMPANSGAVTYSFSAEDAVAYAMNHSDNSSGKCLKYNTVFTLVNGVDDCANFVSQCLCAGGVPMFNGWFYRLPGIPSSWSDTKWFLTYSGYRKLQEKDWLTEVAYDAIRPGDIIYSYHPDASPTPYTHVSIAVSENVRQDGQFGCRVCSYTANRHDKFKALTASNCRCYRVREVLKGDGQEKKVSLPLSGNGATVLAG